MLLSEACDFARSLVANRRQVSIALTRQMLMRNSLRPDPLEARLTESLSVYYTSQADGREGVQAFLEKRTPKFSARASNMPPFYPWWSGK